MINEVSAVKFRQNLGEMLSRVQYRNDSIIIQKDGRPVAALIDSDLFARIHAMRGRFDELTQHLADSYAAVNEAEGLAEIDALVAKERNTRRKKNA